MKNFVIRVELIGHGHDSPAYVRLHEALASKNVLRTITADDGRSFELPSATYSYSGAYSTNAVADWIRAIVTSLDYQHYVLVTGGDSA